MSQGLKRFLATLGAVVLLVYVGAQVIQATYSPLYTEMALPDTVEQTITAEGFAIRDEQLISGSRDGVLVYAVNDGTRVPKGGTVANVYQNEQEAQTQQEILALEQKIAILERVNSQSSEYITNLDQLNSQILNQYISMLNHTEAGRTDSLSEDAVSLIELLSQSRLATNQEEGFDDVIRSLEEEKASLQKKVQEASSITTPESGYFIAQPDGYENAIKYEEALELTPEQFNSLEKSETPASAVGKIMGSYSWYIACVLDAKDAVGMAEGNRATLQLTLSTVEELPATVAAVNQGKDGSQTAVIFRCEDMNQHLAGFRSQRLQIVVKEHSGLRISTSAVRFADGKKGVYVLTGGMARFKEIVPLYAGDGFMICDPNKGGLKAYDDIIMEGKDLYDKKVIR